ncbi:NADH-quinone oxidoreductase subunit NuoN [Ferrovibrio sp.]|uniref:NADH-quinone oxidoreductase subunit NuoN n=1 Tax=Ferrovibrio sp. TaxID=1917215 RepID=UPI0025C00285|nr:NADH-quinone oxidoreductase subunit NuoN [Ferrovibrio sp.]MBX3454777.1 NADH-quinone oxidoreductase subunit NuoN [Ferrovibrio sp.]
MTFASLAPVYPELWLAVAAMALLLLGVFRGEGSTRLVSWLGVAALVVTLVLVRAQPAESQSAFGGMFLADGFARFAKLLILIGSGFAIVQSLGYIKYNRMDRFEYPVLILLASVGMMMMVSANDLMSLYLGLELQSLSLYVLAAFKRDSERATEAGLKYFVLGALSSGMLLYGSSLIYGFTGSTGFVQIAEAVKASGSHASIGLIVGIVFLSAGLAFKVSAVPFHMWVPDVYEGAPTPVTAFFAVAPKIAAVALFCRAMLSPFGDIAADWQQIIIVISALSMLLGAFAAIAQNNIKRLMAYSSIGHVGYALVGLAAGTEEGVRGILIYLAIYLAMNVGTFACILSMRHRDSLVEGVSDLAGLAKTHPFMAFLLAGFMFSLAGVPPLAGFFGKFYIFMAAINAKLYALAVLGMLSSVVSAYYYLRIVKIMYFDEADEPLSKPLRTELGAVMGITGLFTLLFFVYPAPLLAAAQAAAKTLFP